MAHRVNHYDSAFESLLRNRRVPYVRVDEARRSLLEEGSLKSPDFLVQPEGRQRLIVDVKGRRFGSASADVPARRWENWATADDLVSLLKWEDVFGPQFRAALVFVYELQDPRSVRMFESENCFRFQNRNYSAVAVHSDEYVGLMKERSASWQTVYLSAADFRELRVPISSLIGCLGDSAIVKG